MMYIYYIDLLLYLSELKVVNRQSEHPYPHLLHIVLEAVVWLLPDVRYINIYILYYILLQYSAYYYNIM